MTTKIATQLSVHMENVPGALAELTESLAAAKVNIVAVSVPDTAEFGTVRLLCEPVLEAREVLQDGGLAHAAVEVLVVQLPHRPGSLAKMARILADDQIVIRYAYASNPEGAEHGLCVLCVDDIHKARDVLNRKLQ